MHDQNWLAEFNTCIEWILHQLRQELPVRSGGMGFHAFHCMKSHGGCSKVLSFFPGLSQDLREAFASFRAWGFTTVGENGFSLGLEAFKDSCSCPGTSCVL